MKKIFSSVIGCMLLVGVVYIFRENISNFFYNYYLNNSIEITSFTPNSYYRERNYDYVQITDDFVAKDKQHLLNIYYTIINSGIDSFTFKCSQEYSECLNDVESISNSSTILSNINSFVHPFNGFNSIGTEYSTTGKVVIKVEKTYSDEEIEIIDKLIRQFIRDKLINVSSNKEKVKIIHDFIINNTKYDKDRSDNNIVNYKSDIAYGPLVEGYALCGGYTDAMALFLDYCGILNFKVISDNHIWNAVYLDGEWYHLDLTWDDPVSRNGTDILDYSFFLISTEQLLEIENEQHIFDSEVFSELKIETSF